MALKLPWKYKSLIAVVNSYRDGEEDINRAEQNNFAVTGSFESFHPLTFFFLFFFIPSPLPRGGGAGECGEGGWVRSAFKSHFPQQSQPFSVFLFFSLSLSLNSTAPFLSIYFSCLSFSICAFILQPILLRLPLEVQINWCSSDASACWNFFQGIYWSRGPVPSLSFSASLSQ